MTQSIPIQETLFARTGGREGVERIVNGFYARIAADPEMRPLYPEDLAPGRDKLTLFMEEWLGGEPRYTHLYGHPRLRRRHFPFVISERHAGRWLRHMREAMQDAGVPAADMRVIFERLAPLAHHMVNAGEDVPREPLGDVRLT